MRAGWILSVLFASTATSIRQPVPRDYAAFDYFVLEHALSGHNPSEAAAALGLELVEQVGELKDHWLLRAPKSSSHHVHRSLSALRADASNHRDPLVRRTAGRISDAVLSLDQQHLRRRHKRAPPPVSTLPTLSPVAAATAQRLQIRDPSFSQQWHINNDFNAAYTVNVTGVWEEGITGKGVIVAMVDDGVDSESRDLAVNFVRPPPSQTVPSLTRLSGR